MITHEDLKLCASLAKEAQNIRDSIERIEALAEFGKLQGGLTSGFGTPLKDGTGEGASAIADLRKRCAVRIEAYLEHALIVEQTIGDMADPDQRAILRLRYVDGLTWEDTASKACYSRRQTIRIHNAALLVLGIADGAEEDAPDENG